MHPADRVTPSSPMHILQISAAPAMAPQVDSDDDEESMSTSLPMIAEDEITSPMKKLEAHPGRVAAQTPKVIVPVSVDKKNLTGGNELNKVAAVSLKGTNGSNPRPTGGTETMKAPLSKEGTKTSFPKTFLVKTDGKNTFPVQTPVPSEIGHSAYACLRNLLIGAMKRSEDVV